MKTWNPLRWPLAIQLVLALFLGAVIGAVAGPSAAVLGELGVLIIKLLKALAGPLVFFAVLDAFCKTEIGPRRGFKLLAISLTNACVAIAIALSLSHFLPLKDWVDFEKLKSAVGMTSAEAPSGKLPELSFQTLLHTVIPSNVIDPFLNNNVIAVVFLAILLGAGIRALKNMRAKEIETVEKFIDGGLRLISVVLSWVVRIVPLAALAVVAKVVGTAGFSVFSALVVFVGLVTAGLLIHVFVYYSALLFFVARKSPLVFFRQAGESILTALSTGSSLATLPVTLRTLQDKMKISTASSRLAACVGTNLNHDGILLYEAVAALFIAQIQAIPLNFHQEVVICVTSALAAVGIAGVPDAGFITLSLVVGSVGLPLSAVPFLLPVDWFLGRLRAATNVTSDMTVATLLDR